MGNPVQQEAQSRLVVLLIYTYVGLERGFNPAKSAVDSASCFASAEDNGSFYFTCNMKPHHKTAMTDYRVKKIIFPVNTAHVNGGCIRGKENNLHVKISQSNLWHVVG